MELNERRQVEEELRVRARQQAVVVELGQRALAGIDLAALMDEAVERVAETLHVEYSKVLELLPDGEALLLRAGVGWQAGLVGRGTVSAGLESQAGYTLVSHEPVIVEDLATETRFSGPPLLHDHGVVSGISVIIQGEGRPFGVMGAHTTSRRTFTRDDIHFLQAISNVLAAAIQRRRAEEVLRESEARFRVLTEHALAGVYLIQDDRFRYVNPALAAMFGYTPEELIGRLGPLDLTAPEDRDRVAENMRRRVEEGVESVHHTFRGLRKNGTFFECESLGSQGEYAGRPAVLGMLLDITDRKRAEEALRASEEKYRSLFEHASDSIFIIDPATRRFLDLNENAARRLGYTREELLQLTFDDIDTPMAAARNEAIIRELQEVGSVVFEHAHRRKDGAEMPVEISSRIIEYGGRPVFQSFVRDITKRKLAEAKQAHFQSLLKAISDVNQLIVREKDSQAMLQEACRILQRTRGYAGLWIGLLDEAGQHLRQVAGAGVARDIEPVEFSLDEAGLPLYCVRTALAEGRPCLVEDVGASHPCATCTYWARVAHTGAVAVPLRYREGSCGALVVYTEQPWAYDEDETELLFELANDLALGLYTLEAEERLRESEEKYRLLIENANEAIVVVQDDMLKFFNSKAVEIAGYSQEALASTPFTELIHPDDRQMVVENHLKKLAGETLPQTYSFRIIDRSGNTKWMEINAVVIDWEGRPATLNLLTDITERKRAEKSLKEYSERLEEMVEERTAELAYRAGQLEHLRELDASLLGATSLEATLQLLAEGAVTHLGYNGAAVGLYREEERSLVVPAIYPRDSRIEKLRALASASARGALRFSIGGEPTLFNRVMAGETMVVNSLTPFLDTPLPRVVARGIQKLYRFGGVQFVPLMVEGEFVGVLIGVVREREPSARKQAGLALLAGHAAVAIQQAQLREAEQQRTAQLEHAQEQLVRREKLATLGQLAGGVAHELRNPLGAISNAAYFLNLVLEDPQPAVKETLEILDREVRTSEKIISSLLDYARARPPVRQTVNVNALVQQALSRAGVPANIQVKTHLDETLPAIQADPEQLAQVFDNLIRNAVQAMPAGGQLSVNSEQLSVTSDQSSVISEQSPIPSTQSPISNTQYPISISFTDTGIGIPPENMDKLFEPLFTTRAKGIGLGLALCKMLVEAHGGTIEVESEVGEGSTFTVKLIGDQRLEIGD